VKSRRQLQILGISLVVMVLQAAACAPAPAPPPTSVAAAPGVSTPAPANPAAAPVPTAAPAVAPTVAPTMPAATAAVVAPPIPVSSTPTVAAAPSAPQQVSFSVVDCGSDFGCLVDASRRGAMAKLDNTMAVNFFGLFLSNTDAIEIKGREGDRLLFSQKTVQAVATGAEALVKAAESRGISGAKLQQALTTAQGVAELVQAAESYLGTEDAEQLRDAREIQKARMGAGKECKFPQEALTSMLERWQQGRFSSTDWEPADCTDLRGEGFAAPTESTGTAPDSSPRGLKLLDASALPAELSSIPVPPGFGVEQGSTGRSAPNGVFRSADASLFGKMSTEDLRDFYMEQLAAEWEMHAEDAGPWALILVYVNKEDTSLALYIAIEETDEGTTVDLRVERN
jgi:hypothetical protein